MPDIKPQLRVTEDHAITYAPKPQPAIPTVAQVVEMGSLIAHF